jgi:hypothetical protein
MVGLVLGLICLAVLAVVLWPKSTPQPAPDSPTPPVALKATELKPAPPTVQIGTETSAPPVVRQPAVVDAVPNRPVQASASKSLPPASPQTRALVNSLVQLQLGSGPLTEDQANSWKKNLKDLVAQGASAVPAIREFLAKNVDLDFGTGGSQALGYGSARAALFDALTQIGGPDSVAALSEALQVSADPREVALLAQGLDKLEPGQHQQEALDAARATLDMANPRKPTGADVAPLFEVLDKYGGSGAVADLLKASAQWGYYAPIALAQLPDQAGVPSLVELAQDPKASPGARDSSLQMLAMVSDQSQPARDTLLQQAKANAISDFAWRLMGPMLAGDSIGFQNSGFQDTAGYVSVGGYRSTATSDNQHFFSVPTDVSAAAATQRTTLINDLLAVTSNPIGQQVLQQSRDALARRMAPPAGSGGP